MVMVLTGIYALLFGYVGIATPLGWISFAMVILMVLLGVYSVYFVRKLARDSYFEITSDDRLICVYRGRAKIEYPIKEMVSIEEATFKDARQKHATVPVVLNSRGAELYPADGVLITFNRAWIKSIFPIYFNPADIEGFIGEIRQRMRS